MAETKEKADIVFGTYTGAKLWNVTYGNKTCTVSAPDEDSAMVAAASFWKKRWQDYDFYAYCYVTKA